jgi:hypothetical protein
MVSPGGVLLSTRLLTSSLIEASQTTVAENTRHVKEICEKYFGYPFSDIPKDIKNLIWAWRMVDRGSCQHWLRGQVDSGQWNPLDIAGWCISSRLSDGKQILDAFQGETLDDLLGLDYLRQILHDQLKVLPELEGREFFDTVEDRRLAALYCLRSSSERADLQYQIHLDSDRKARLDRSVSHGAPLSPTEQARNSWIGSGLRFLTIFGR